MSTGQDDKVGAAPVRCRPPARAVRTGRAPGPGQDAGNAREGGGQELAELFFDTPGGVDLRDRVRQAALAARLSEMAAPELRAASTAKRD
jgi:hypothetical protein